MSRFKIDEHKLYYHLDRVVEWLYGDKFRVFPIYIEISPVGYCNHRCTFCALDYLGYKKVKLDTTTLKLNIQSMACNGVRSIMFAGEGEPLLHPAIGEIVEWTARHGIDVAVTTNAIPLTRKLSRRMLNHCTWVKVSCNAGDPATYAKIHGCPESHWDTLWENLEYAVYMRNHTFLNKTTIGVQAVLLPENAHTLTALARKCRDVGVDYLVIKPYSQHKDSKTTRYADIVYEDIYNKYLHVLSMYASSNFEIITRAKSMKSWDSELRGYGKCYSIPYFWAYVMASGDVYGCSAFLGNKKFCYGNINKTIFKEVWLGKKRELGIGYIENALNVRACRKNCRMHKINNFLWGIKHPGEHKNFI